MKIYCTDDVVFGPVSPRIVVVLLLIASCDWGGSAYVTAVANGRHMEGSKHTPSEDTGYDVDAVDIDTTTEVGNDKLETYLRMALPPEYDVVREDEGEENDHVHVEVDPENQDFSFRRLR